MSQSLLAVLGTPRNIPPPLAGGRDSRFAGVWGYARLDSDPAH
jgi:hypothetical protein